MNTLDKVQGWCDSPLTSEGEQVAQWLGKGLRHIHFQAAYCSTLRRTYETAKIILDAKGEGHIPPIEVSGFKEVGFGGFESDSNLRMWQSAAFFLGFRSYEAMVDAIFSREISYREAINSIHRIDSMGIAESFEQVESRTQNALKEIARKEQEKGTRNIMIVSHAMSICCMLLGFGADKLLNNHLENASVCKVSYHNDAFTIESMNDMSYVEQGKALSS